MMTINYNDFERVDIRAGKITKVEGLPGARKSVCKLTIDYGSEIGIKKSSVNRTTRPLLQHYLAL